MNWGLMMREAFSILNMNFGIPHRQNTLESPQMKHLRFLALFVFAISISYASGNEAVKQIRVFVSDQATLDRIWSSGIDHEGSEGKVGGWMTFIAGSEELNQLRNKAIGYEIIVEDLASYYASRLAPGPVNALGFGFGSMGGYYTYAEIGQQLDSLRLLYPNLITAKQTVGTSIQNRPIWAVKMTANPGGAPARPQVHLNALTHAREPAGMMSLFYFMWYLVENYGSNPEVTYLLNNRELWFIPMLNPDGYVYNQSTNPGGGGMWRKNRRLNGDGTYGVDLNRNYGFQWGYDNSGSSNTPSSDTYRGTGPFSEPETQAIRDFCNSRFIKSALNYHTYSNLLIYPWGYIGAETVDSIIFREYANDMTQFNRYRVGTAQQLLYPVNGVADDWMYGEQIQKGKIISMTPEVGTSSDGFWPSTNRILPLAQENLFPNLYLAWSAGAFPKLQQRTLVDANGDGYLARGESFDLRALVRNKGLMSAQGLRISAEALTPNLTILSPAINLVALDSRRDSLFVFAGQVSPYATNGTEGRVLLKIELSNEITLRDTIRVAVGLPTIAFTDGAETGTSNWNISSGWGRHSTARSGSWSFTDSPAGQYGNNINSPLTKLTPIPIPLDASSPKLNFWTRWDIETTYDHARVEVSTNNGSTWVALAGRYTTAATGSGAQIPAGTHGYQGTQTSWVQEEIDLLPYIGRNLSLRFRLMTDGSVTKDGIYVDDIAITYYVPTADTGVVIRPLQFAHAGTTGMIFRDSMKVYNFTSLPVQFSIAETSFTTTTKMSEKSFGTLDMAATIERLRNAFRKSNISREMFHPNLLSAPTPLETEVFTTIATDERGENPLDGADVYRLQYQYRTVPFVGNFHDFRIVMRVLPDTNVAGFISIDTDQEFATGAFPTPYGAGPTSRDIGSEREIFFDASGILIDSLLGIGRIRAGVVISTATDTIIGSPFLLAISRDSVLSISTNGLNLGVREEWLSDPDRKMNVGAVAARIGQTVNPMPDYAPGVSHGLIGTPRGVSWMSQNPTAFSISAGDSATVRLVTLAAKNPGTYNAAMRMSISGRPTASIPVNMIVTQAPAPRIIVQPTAIIDTLFRGDSSAFAIRISNVGGGQLTYGILDTAGTAWFSANPVYGVLDSAGSEIVMVTLRSAGLNIDTTYRAQFTVVSNDPASNAIPVSVTLRVTSTTAVREGDAIPTQFALMQNYPNPFNPTTNFQFAISNLQFVNLKVYDILGREVATVVSQELKPGYYTVKFDAAYLSSGLYFYRLTAGAFTDVKKMVLIR